MVEASARRQTLSVHALLVLPLSILLLLACTVARASPPGDLSAWLKSQDAALGATAGTIVIDQPGRIEAPVTLQPRHTLEIRSAVDWSATVHLAGSNTVRCLGGAVIHAHLPAYEPVQHTGALLMTEGGTEIHVIGCRVDSEAPSLLFGGYPVSDLDMTGNSLNGLMLLAVVGPGQRLTLAKNVLTSAKPSAKYAGIELNDIKNVTVSGNSFTNLAHGAMWWGGDSAAPGASIQKVTTTGQMSFTGNVCKNIGGACIWGSMGYDIVMRGNSADGCGDVCFDAEGGLRTEIIDNTAVNCNNGCAAVFFFSDQTTISNNHFHAQAPGGGLIFLKNSSQDPVRHDHLLIQNNDLQCVPDLCRAVYQEAAGGIRFSGNEVKNGTWLPVGYARSVSITNNHLVYTRALTGPSAAIIAPGMIGGTALEVTGNRIESNVTQPAGSACIAAGWTDFNATDTHLIAANSCAGSRPFPTGLSIVTDGKNHGVAAVWILSANQLGSAPIHHEAKSPNEHFFDLGQCGPSGCKPKQDAINAVRTLPGCTGSAPAVVAGSMPVCLGPVRGWGTVVLPR